MPEAGARFQDLRLGQAVEIGRGLPPNPGQLQSMPPALVAQRIMTLYDSIEDNLPRVSIKGMHSHPRSLRSTRSGVATKERHKVLTLASTFMPAQLPARQTNWNDEQVSSKRSFLTSTLKPETM